MLMKKCLILLLALIFAIVFGGFASAANSMSSESSSNIDVAVTAVNAPEIASPGDKIKVYANVKNIGSVNAGKFAFYIGLGEDNGVVNENAMYKTSISSLAAEQSKTVIGTITIPSNLKSGKYYVNGLANPTGTIQDDNSNNDHYSTPIIINKYHPDLIISSIKAPLEASQEEKITITTTVKNIGNIAAGQFYVYMGSLADENGYRHLVTSLGAGKSKTITISQTIPSDIKNGKYQIGALVNPTGSVLENMQNDRKSISITINPNLKITSTIPSNEQKTWYKDTTIAIKFNKGIQPSTAYNNIRVKALNTPGGNVSIKKWINGNILCIKKTGYVWNINYIYQVIIPKASVKSYANADLAKTTSFTFQAAIN